MKRFATANLVVCLLLAIAVSLTPAATPASRTKILAIFFTADWCGACKVLKPKFNEVKRSFGSQPIFFTEFDLTDDFTREQGARYAELLNLEAIYGKYVVEQGGTGFVLLIDVNSRKPVGTITSNLSPTEIRERLTKALGLTAASNRAN